MRNVAMSLGAAALLTTAGVYAQAPQSQPDPKQTVTITGCVAKETDVLKSAMKEAKPGMTDEFVLTNSTVQTSMAPAAAPAAPATPPEPTGTSGSNKVYRVTGPDETSLKEHLGHKVEITGTFKSESDARRELGAIGTSGRPPATAAEPTAANTPEITIKSVKMLSETCGG